jgi:TetR/AcrR family transcriptional regulator, cholesterol catabolism regulator
VATGTKGESQGVRSEEVLAAAADLFAEQGYVSTTVRDIADAAGILSGSLYHHFDSKEAMLDAILGEFIEHTLAGYAEVLGRGCRPTETFEALLRASLGSMVDHRSAILIYQNEARFLLGRPRFAYLADAHREFERIWTGVLGEGVRDGEFRADLDPNLAYRLVRDTIWAAPRWYRPGGTLDPARIVEQYLAVLIDGVALR